MWYLFAFLFFFCLFYVLILVLSVFFFNSHMQLFIAWAVWGLLHPSALLRSAPVELTVARWRATILVSGIIATVLCFAVPQVLFALLTKVLSCRAQNRALPALCRKAGLSFFFFSLWTKVISTVIFSLQSAIVSLAPNPREWLYHSSVMRLVLIYLDGLALQPPIPHSLASKNNLATTLLVFVMYIWK